MRSLWLDRTNQKNGEADWSGFLGRLMYSSDRNAVIQWIEHETGWFRRLNVLAVRLALVITPPGCR